VAPTEARLWMLGAYVVGLAIALVIVTARPDRGRGASASPEAGGGASGRTKLPSYVAITFGMLAASWAPAGLHAFDLLVSVLAAASLVELARPPGRTAAGRRLAAAVWVVGATFGLAVLHSRDAGGILTAFGYLVVATNDGFAQLIGERFGSTRLAPRLSPTKTRQGALAGLVAGCAMGAALAPATGFTVAGGALLGLALGAAGLLGDLSASALKRALDLRQFGVALGPHGGVLDRFDSWFATGPVYLAILVGVGRF
jgi:phosphatidate cytidylyltransferase